MVLELARPVCVCVMACIIHDENGNHSELVTNQPCQYRYCRYQENWKILRLNRIVRMSELDENDIPHQKLYLCVHRFVRVPVSMVYSCLKGSPRIWKLYPVIKEKELRSCK